MSDDGTVQLVTPDRIQAIERQFDADYEYAVKSGTHLWIVTTAHRISTDALVDIDRGGSAIADAESLRLFAIGCYVCEQVYTPRDRLRRCPGEPRGGEGS